MGSRNEIKALKAALRVLIREFEEEFPHKNLEEFKKMAGIGEREGLEQRGGVKNLRWWDRGIR